MTALVGIAGNPAFSPLPKQAVALAAPAYELLYGGAKGGGKTHYLLACFLDILWAAHVRFMETRVEQGRCRIIIFRRNIKDLQDIIVKGQEIYKAFDPEATFNESLKFWRFQSGARVELHHIDGPDDHRGYNGQELIAVGYDQVEEIPEEQYAFINANVRTGDEYYKPFLRVRCTANPGGRYGDWVRRRFIDPHPQGGKILEERVTVGGQTMVVTRAFIPSKLKDNKYLAGDGTYEAKLRATMPEHMVQRLLEGDWSVIDGAFFASRVRPDAVFVHSKDVRLNDGWDVVFGLDWGASNPACTLWAALDDAEDRIIFFDELYTPGVSGGAYAEHMLDKVRGQQWSRTRRWNVSDFYGLIDKQGYDNYMGGASAGEIIEQHGFRLFPANKDRKLGISQILERLQVRADGQAGVLIMADRCPMLKQALMSVSVDKVDMDDYDKRHNMAHAVDAMRFVLVNWPVSKREELHPVDAEVARFNELLKRATKKPRPDADGSGYS